MKQNNPQRIGRWMFEARKKFPEASFDHIADMIPWEKLKGMPKHTSMQASATYEYQSELKARASQGDKYAKAVLEEGGWNEPTD